MGSPVQLASHRWNILLRHCSVKNLGSFGTPEFFLLISSSGIELFLHVKFLHSKRALFCFLERLREFELIVLIVNVGKKF